MLLYLEVPIKGQNESLTWWNALLRNDLRRLGQAQPVYSWGEFSAAYHNAESDTFPLHRPAKKLQWIQISDLASSAPPKTLVGRLESSHTLLQGLNQGSFSTFWWFDSTFHKIFTQDKGSRL